MNQRFDIGETINLKGYMSEDYCGERFIKDGNELLLRAILEHAKKIGKNINGVSIYPKARVKSYLDFCSSEKCFLMVVEWVDPFDDKKLLPNINEFRMFESEFREFNEPIYRVTSFKTGDWVYYMGAAAGGYDTGPDYWQEGLVGKISRIERGMGDTDYLRFDKIGKMTYAGNTACAFRKATHSEIMNAAHEEFVSKHGPTIDSMEPISIKKQEDEIKVSFQSTKLIANKVANSKEVENFLLLN